MRSAQQISSAERALRKHVIEASTDPVEVRIAYAVEQALRWARGGDMIHSIPEAALRHADCLWRELRRGRG